MSADDRELLLMVIWAAATFSVRARASVVSSDLLRSARARSLASNVEVGDILTAAAMDDVSFRWRAEICRSACLSLLPKCLAEESGEIQITVQQTDRMKTNRIRPGKDPFDS